MAGKGKYVILRIVVLARNTDCEASGILAPGQKSWEPSASLRLLWQFLQQSLGFTGLGESFLASRYRGHKYTEAVVSAFCQYVSFSVVVLSHLKVVYVTLFECNGSRCFFMLIFCQILFTKWHSFFTYKINFVDWLWKKSVKGSCILHTLALALSCKNPIWQPPVFMNS